MSRFDNAVIGGGQMAPATPPSGPTAPQITSAASIAGVKQVGKRLTGNPGTVEGGTIERYSWELAGVAVGEGKTLTVKAAGALRFGALWTGPGGSVWSWSPAVTVEAVVTPTPDPTPGTLTLAASSVVENSPAGTIVGGILGGVGTITIPVDSGGQFAVSGGKLVTTAIPVDFDAETGGAATRAIRLRDTAAGVSKDFDFTITVVNVNEKPALNALSLNGLTTLKLGTPASGAIHGASAGSAIAYPVTRGGFTIDGPARTWAWSGAGAEGTASISLVETLGDSPNSPRLTPLSITIAEADPVDVALIDNPSTEPAAVALPVSGSNPGGPSVDTGSETVTVEFTANQTDMAYGLYFGSIDGTDKNLLYMANANTAQVLTARTGGGGWSDDHNFGAAMAAGRKVRIEIDRNGDGIRLTFKSADANGNLIARDTYTTRAIGSPATKIGFFTEGGSGGAQSPTNVTYRPGTGTVDGMTITSSTWDTATKTITSVIEYVGTPEAIEYSDDGKTTWKTAHVVAAPSAGDATVSFTPASPFGNLVYYLRFDNKPAIQASDAEQLDTLPDPGDGFTVTPNPVAAPTTFAATNDSGWIDTNTVGQEIVATIDNANSLVEASFGGPNNYNRIRINNLTGLNAQRVVNGAEDGGLQFTIPQLPTDRPIHILQYDTGIAIVVDNVQVATFGMASVGDQARINAGFGFQLKNVAVGPDAPAARVLGFAFDDDGNWTAEIFYTGSPGSLRYSQTGNVTGDVQIVANPTPGRAAIKVPIGNQMPALFDLRLSHANAPSRLQDVVVSRPQPPIMGINEANAFGYAYFNALGGTNNRFLQARCDFSGPTHSGKLRPTGVATATTDGRDDTTGASAGMGSDGVIHQYGTSVTGKANDRITMFLPHWWEPGEYDTDLPAGMDVAFQFNGAPISWDGVKLTVTGNGHIGANSANPNLTLTGPIPAAGIDPNLNFRAIKKGADKSKRVAQAVIDSFADLGTGWFRDMDLMGVNGTGYRTLSDLYYGIAGDGISSPIEVALEIATRTLQHLWHCFGIVDNDEHVGYQLDRIVEWLVDNPWAMVALELANEIWNNQFVTCLIAMIEGAKLGFHTDAGTGPAVNPTYDIGYDGDPKVPLTAGTVVFSKNVAGIGAGLWRAKRNVIAGDTKVQSVSNDTWELVATNDQMIVSGARYTAHRSKQIWAMADAKMAAAGISLSRRQRILAWKSDGSYGEVVNMLQWENVGALVDSVAFGFYYGGGIAGQNILNYSDHETNWGPTEKALLGTNRPAFMTALLARMNVAQDITMAYARGFKRDIMAFFKKTWGTTPHFDAYEIGQHLIVFDHNGWDSTGGQIRTVMMDLSADQRFADAEARYARLWARDIGGKHMHYNRGGFIPKGGDDYAWGIQPTEGDRTQPRYTAIKTVAAEMKARALEMAA